MYLNLYSCYNTNRETRSSLTDHIIRVQDLTKRFPAVAAVDHVSFGVGRGEFFCLVGPNGAGKTTLINMLCTLLKPSEGTAVIDGADVAAQPDAVRRMIGLVFQDATLDHRLTAWENLEFHAVVYHIPKADRRRRIEDVLRLVELERHTNDVIDTFSGGMKRRLEIARGLLHAPAVLFLDEPTIGLDPQTRSRIWRYLDELRSRTGMTVFFTTHYLEEAESCDRVGIIDHGKLIALDTPAALKDSVAADMPVRPPVPSGPTLEDVFLKLTGREIREEDAPPESRLGPIAAWVKRRG